MFKLFIKETDRRKIGTKREECVRYIMMVLVCMILYMKPPHKHNLKMFGVVTATKWVGVKRPILRTWSPMFSMLRGEETFHIRETNIVKFHSETKSPSPFKKERENKVTSIV